MDYTTAVNILGHHSGWEPNLQVKSLSSSLQPFERKLINKKEFDNIKDAIQAVYFHFKGEEKIDRKIFKYINSILEDIYNFAIEEDSPLRSNKLISTEQLNFLRKFHDEVRGMVYNLLIDRDPDGARFEEPY